MWEQPVSSTIPLGLIFTDTKGQVVFVDYYFLRLIRCDDADKIIGGPLHIALGIDPKVARQFLKAIVHDGFVHKFPFEIKPECGDPVSVLCTGVATYDDREDFIGTDLTLYDPTQDGIPEMEITHHRDVLSARIQEIQAEATALLVQDHAQVYVKAQIGGLQILIARMGGPRIRDTLNAILSKIIAQHAWPVRIDAGQVAFDEDELDPAVYSTLMTDVVRYAANVIGHRMVVQELRAADGQMDPVVIAAVDPLGLRRFLEDRTY